MAIDYPASPTNGQTYTYGNRTWQYSSSITAWTDISTVYPTFGTNFAVTGLLENITVVSAAATGTINFNASTGTVMYYTIAASGNYTLNFRSSATVSLNTLLAVGQSITFVFMSTVTSSAFYNSAITIDGVSVTPKWYGGITPTTALGASGIEFYTYNIIKTGSAAYTVTASQSIYQ